MTFGAQTKTTPYQWSIALRPNVAPSETVPLRLNEAERAAAVELLRQQEVRVEWVGDDEVVVMLKGASASTSMLHKAGEKLDGQASSSTLSFASATSLSRRKAEAMNMLPPELSNWLLWSLCGLYVDHEVQQHADAQMAKRLQQFEEDRPTASPDWADDLEDNHDENNGGDVSAITRSHICCYGAVYSATEDYVHLLVVDEEFVVTGGKPKYHQPPGADAAAIAAPQPPQVPTRNAFDALEGMDVPTAVVADATDNEADTVPDSWDEIEDAGDEL